MKIYIENLDLSRIINNVEIIKKYEIKNKSYIIFYSNEGIFELNKNNLYKLYQKDKEIFNDKIESNNINYTLLYDKSFYIKENVFCLPNLYEEKKIKKVYHKKDNSFITFIIEYSKNNILDFYFELDEKLLDNHYNDVLKNQISSFLSILKNI